MEDSPIKINAVCDATGKALHATYELTTNIPSSIGPSGFKVDVVEQAGGRFAGKYTGLQNGEALTVNVTDHSGPPQAQTVTRNVLKACQAKAAHPEEVIKPDKGSAYNPTLVP
jgi:hypothetical protein